MTDNLGKNWLLRAPNEPAANLANYIHERESLPLPVPIDAMVSEVATIEEHAWPYDCDAVVVGLLNDTKQTIFVKRDAPRRRIRFTLAHEYGHIMMSWHLGEIACKLSDEAFSIEPLGTATSPEDLLARRRLAEQEAEATRFASYLLLPEHFMRPLIEKGDMNQVLEEAGKLDVSAQALVMRLREMLQPGFAFIYPANGQQECTKSSGTVIPKQATRNYGVYVPELRTLSKDYGTVNVSDREVHWFRLVDYDSLVPVQDSRTTTEILRSAISAVIFEPTEQLRAFASINGVAGGSLSKERANSPEQALAILRHKFSECKFPQVIQHLDFDLYLRRKAEEWAQKRMAC